MNVSQNWTMNDIEITLRRGFFRFQESIRHHTPLRCGGSCLAWIELFDLKELQKVLRFLRKVKLKYRIHHPFEDWVVHDSGFKGVVIRLRGDFEDCQIASERRNPEGEVLCQSGLRIGVSTLWCQIETSPWKDIFADLRKYENGNFKVVVDEGKFDKIFSGKTGRKYSSCHAQALKALR